MNDRWKVLDLFEKQIRDYSQEGTTLGKFLVLHYNCWQYDYYDEPSVAIISSMLDKIDEEERLFGEKTEEFIKQKPATLPFCKVVAVINTGDLWNSQIIIFYDESYFNNFWVRNTEEQTWTHIATPSKSFIKKHNIKTELNEIGYTEIISDGDFYEISKLWFYGDI